MKFIRSISLKILLTFCVGFTFTSAFAVDYYVSAINGLDTNNGLSAATAFRTIQKAESVVQPGDVVLIGNGIYRGSNPVLTINKSGKPDAWITWKAQSGHNPEIHPRGWSGIEITGSYHILEGLKVIGANDSLTLIDALKEAQNKTANPLYNTNGIFINGRKNDPDNKPHHVIIRNCEVGKCPGGGITAIETDYITIEDCLVYENAWYMRYAGSGITTLNNWAFDDAPGYHIIIQRNLVWNNKTLVPWERIGKLSDGNGILLDVTDNAQGATNPNADASLESKKTENAAVPEKPQRPEWKGRALIANNVSAYNGGSGIHTFRTKYVDIIYNTTYWNGQVVGYQELFPNRSEDIVILNNIIVPKPGGKVTSYNRNVNIKWDYNVYPESQSVFVGPNDILCDPGFVDIQRDLRNANFRLISTSKAIDTATDELAQPTDITGNSRPIGNGIDRGAFEQ